MGEETNGGASLMQRRIVMRALAATIFAAPVAAFCASVAISGWMTVSDLSRDKTSVVKIIEKFTDGVVLLTLLGTIFLGLFSMFFTLTTQVPLTFLYRWRGKTNILGHLVVSGLLGAASFIALFPITNGVRFDMGDLSSATSQYQFLGIVAIGSIGGVAVALLWHWLVLRVLFVGNYSNG